MVEPPSSGPRKHQIPGAARLEMPQMSDGGSAVSRIVTGVHAALVLREVRRSIAVQPHERLVTLACDEHDRPRWHVQTDPITNAIDELQVPVLRHAHRASPRQPSGAFIDRPDKTNTVAERSSPSDRYELRRCSPNR